MSETGPTGKPVLLRPVLLWDDQNWSSHARAGGRFPLTRAPAQPVLAQHGRKMSERGPTGENRRCSPVTSSTPNGIRTRAAGVKGRSPRPLDDGGLEGRV